VASAILRDGTRVSGPAPIVEMAVYSDRLAAAEQREWVARLRSEGVKAAHPDDGWVDRDANKVHLAYPDFNDGLTIGDLLALGSCEAARIVRVTGTSELGWIPTGYPGPWFFHFESVDGGDRG
jgi:hypothetical protein